MKLLFITIDGMRADMAKASEHPFLVQIEKRGRWTYGAKTVFPSVTLPAHYSMMYGVPPQRHGILTNHYAVPVRPINGIFEQVFGAGKQCGMFTNWVEMRDVSSPSVLLQQYCLSNKKWKINTDFMVAAAAKETLKTGILDFAFVHFVATDNTGHKNGWCGEEYRQALDNALSLAQDLYESVKDEYALILTADHGGHDRTHGTDLEEDMTVPFFALSDSFGQGEIENVSILDIAPTVASLLEIPPEEEWEGKILAL